LSVRNEDGSWGGDKNIKGTIEETALAISALSSEKNIKECIHGLKWLDEFYSKNGLISSPIGLYFALLWYDEKMYPITAYIEALVRVLNIEF
jgi:squalene-hopene/tetraprenyl-beta-curcumene cyclase